MKPELTSIKDLRLGDRVQVGAGAYMTATVYEVTDQDITLYRPYVAISDFSYGHRLTGNRTEFAPEEGRVIHYIGTEEIRVLRDSSMQYLLLERGPESLTGRKEN